MSGNNLIEKINALATRTGQSDKALAAGIDAVSAVANAKVSNVDISGSSLVVTKGAGASASTDTIPIPSAGAATKNSLGTVQIGDNINVNDGIISVGDATASAKGVVQLDSEISSSATKVPASAIIATELAKFPEKKVDFYVDATNGDDANDGLTAATAWKTLTHAVEAFPAYYPNAKRGFVLHVADGTYTEDVEFTDYYGYIKFGSAVTIDGDFSFRQYNPFVTVTAEDGATSTLTVTGRFLVNEQQCLVYIPAALSLVINRNMTVGMGAFLCSDGAITIDPSTKVDCISVGSRGSCVIRNTLTVTGYTGDTSHSMVYVDNGGYFHCTGAINFTGDNAYAIFVAANSSANISGTLTIQNANFSSRMFYIAKSALASFNAVTVTSTTCVFFAYAAYNSTCTFGGAISFTGTISSDVFYAEQCSSIHCSSTVTMDISGNGVAVAVLCALRESFIRAGNAVTVTMQNQLNQIFIATQNSYIGLEHGSAQHTINASVVRGVVYCSRSGGFLTSTSKTFAGTVTGKKYLLETGGSISLGASKLNGSQAGTLDTATYCFAAN